jgi:hypothetical protein
MENRSSGKRPPPHVYDDVGNVIETHEHKADFKER